MLTELAAPTCVRGPRADLATVLATFQTSGILPIGTRLPVRRRDDEHQPGEVLAIKTKPDNTTSTGGAPCVRPRAATGRGADGGAGPKVRRSRPGAVRAVYYIHYIDFNKRLDEWVTADRLDVSNPARITLPRPESERRDVRFPHRGAKGPARAALTHAGWRPEPALVGRTSVAGSTMAGPASPRWPSPRRATATR